MLLFRFRFTHQAVALCVKWRHGRHLENVTSDLDNPTTSIDAYLLEEQSCQISSRSDLKRRSLRLFKISLKSGRPNTNKMSSDMRSVRDVKISFPNLNHLANLSFSISFINKETKNLVNCLPDIYNLFPFLRSFIHFWISNSSSKQSLSLFILLLLMMKFGVVVLQLSAHRLGE